ncbi:hypothetical protein BOKEGFJH_00234 [Chlamydia avium]|uniref:Uncharacterized protein n=2 Tax=Chlamydia avium TaxID=1457141 RepID=W8JFZ3_9CHLA|nr:hypothetical protein [Chlamydia avium]AHK63110.1 Uncharacterized protein M832_02430 [Chlamydia avium 10DC88]EPP36703.1 hypothetical protein CP10743SC13_0564 [Chlamydia psittaci 10_743_SC13]EPP38356.1 hypothetical protein CP10881SC42_0648 [Chlamydia avium]VVT42722.1 hypothetical protein BOKEGFJH_00234 [Chlamydia avium]
MVVAQSNTNEEMEKLISKAIKKVCGSKENDLCRYLPGPSGGYMHHFTLKKMKTASPEQFLKMLKTFILESDSPRMINPKPRAPRGSKKRRDFINFTKTDIERVLELARRVGDKDLLARFSPKKPLPSLKRELIRSIRNGVVSFELWNAYVEAVKANSSSLDSPQPFV